MKRSASLGRGLARVDASGRDTLVAFAAGPGQEAADGAERNSPFTSALLKHLPKPGLEVSVMLKEVAADVRRDTRGSQRPQQLSDMTRTFYFAKAEPAAAVASAPAGRIETPRSSSAEDRSLEVAFWNAAQSANECDAVRAYLQRFPNGIFVELAGLSERRLCGQARRITVIEPTPTETPPATGAAPAMQSALPTAEPSRPAQPGPVMAALPEVTAPTPELGAALSGPELARNIQLELIRVGCTNGRADGNWGSLEQGSDPPFQQACAHQTQPRRAVDRAVDRAAGPRRARVPVAVRAGIPRERQQLPGDPARTGTRQAQGRARTAVAQAARRAFCRTPPDLPLAGAGRQASGFATLAQFHRQHVAAARLAV